MKHPIFKEKRWVVWNLEEVGGRMTKVPYSISGKKASSTDESSWTTYEKAFEASAFFSGIGVVFTPDQTLLGIDIDHVIEDGKIIGEHASAIEALIKNANTYTEISPSGNGLHLYLHLTEALSLEANRHAPFEAYTSGRYFTFTGNSFHVKPKVIRTIEPVEALKLLEGIGYPWKKEAKAPAVERRSLLDQPLWTDEQLLNKMFDSKNGADIKKLYEGSPEAKEGDLSRADASLLSHLAFWSRKDPVVMERIWLGSPLGKREKTQTREDYRTRSITAAIKSCEEVYQTQEERIFEETGVEFMFTMNAKGDKVIVKNTENVVRALTQSEEFSDTLRFDTFKNRIEIRQDEKWRAFVDSDAIYLQTQLQVTFPFLSTVGKDMVFDAVVKAAKDNSIDSAADFIRSIEWDGEARLDSWLSKVYGVEDDEYHRAVGSNWIKGLVKRLIYPGCKFDYVLVLEGEQGVKKSTSLAVLGTIPNGDYWHVETTMSTDNKDFFMQFEGKAIIEFSEGETATRTEVKKMKGIITTAVDRYRPSYGRISEDFPRRCVFAMTTNQDEYLKDETGNRRWLPVKVVKDQADVEWLEANREQLFAEAYQRVTVLGENTYEFPKEETMRQQESRRVSDPNEDRIAEWYYNDPFKSPQAAIDGITVQDVYMGALSGFGPMKKYDQMSIAVVLKKMGLESRRKMVNGVQSMRWFPPQARLLDLEKLDTPTVTAEDIPEEF